MTACRMRTTLVVAAVSMAVTLAACGKAGESGPPGGTTPDPDGFSVGLLLPENQTFRYEEFDRPLIEKKIKELCDGCTVEYANARQSADTQQRQVASMITKGVKVLILDPVDSRSISSSVKRANEANIPVLSYDRLAEGPISAYTSFDNERVGRIQGKALLEALGDNADDGQIVMMNGAPTDPNAAEYKKGALSVLQGRVKIGKSYDTAEWKPSNAHTNMTGAISALGANGIDGVYAANDGVASGVISALKASNVRPLPPVTGQDAELAGVQRIVAGEQYMSVYKPYRPEAHAAAEMAIALGRGDKLDDIAEDEVSNATATDVPAVLITPIPLTVDNINETVVRDGLYTIDQICPPKLKSACEKAGLTG
ncbi:substrate-binding domain-containing protein [Streptomyces gobiensis]|uniref:substrate-binding domain-containing protein n=1 Tax=Streptomyces gobiensis TaxID=2875706 RepID=UPI001E55FA41|nr:substrate-binding domain-containing protein [Streptomyces gobiensis]UGY94118.1 substrate-binding domain-containing protein [Streptomyces gobiensis]